MVLGMSSDFVGSRELGETQAVPWLTLNVNNRSAFHSFVVDRHNDDFLASKKEAAPRFSSERRLIEAAEVCRARIARLGLAMQDVVAMHHWMALLALKADRVAEAKHHVKHIIELVEDEDHRHQMEEVLEALMEVTYMKQNILSRKC